MKSFLKKNIIPILTVIGFIYTIPVYNKYWFPFDEGIIAVAAQRVLAGEIPYKDFFIVMYPPGQIYVMAALFKIFASSLIVGRIYAVLISVASTTMVFFMARALTGNMAASLFSWLIALVSLGPRLGAVPTPIWPGMLLGLISIYLFIRYLNAPQLFLIIVTGLITGLAITFRHDIGIFAFIAIIFPLSIHSIYKKCFKNILFFTLGAAAVVLPWLAYFMNVSASKDLFDSLIAFTFIHEKTASIAFPRPCLDLNMIFHGSLHFITINQFYIPVIVYLYILILLLSKSFRHSSEDKGRGLSLLSVLLFGIFTFNQARIRPDPAHLLSVIEPALVLSAVIFHEAFSSRFKLSFKYSARYAIAIIISFLLALLFVKNVDKYLKNAYSKPYKNSTVKTVFDKGALYVPREERDDLLKTLEYIKENTVKGERIYLGNAAHWKDDFGGSLIIYFLADRLPSTKYYELLPGLVTDEKVQREIVYSLKAKDVRIIILQDVETSGVKREDLSQERFILDYFLQRNYIPAAKFGKYNIYKRRE